MSEEVQPGVRIDSGVWQRFREDIESRKGSVRGHLRTELETAIQQYLDSRSDPALDRIEAKVDYLAAEMDADVSDVATPSDTGDTHTRDRPIPDEKPPANAATEKKVAYLAGCVIDSEAPKTREIQQVPSERLRDIVKDEYGFRRDTAKRYVDELRDYFDLEPHPHTQRVLVTTDERDRLLDDARDDLEDDAAERMEELEQ